VKFTLLEIALCLLAAFVFLNEVRKNQLKPHRLVIKCNGTIWTDVMITNPAYVTFDVKQRISTNGFEYYQVAKTNYYWSVWPIFPK